MNSDRQSMESALKTVCLPFLREIGFKGSFPNLYRDTDGFVSLINFQFSSAGGSFCVNISFADKLRTNIYFNKEAVPKDLRVSFATEQARLGAKDLFGDHWFSFGPTSGAEFRGNPQNPAAIAAQINQLVIDAAQPWWLKHAGES
jgi:hypothetical protein